jgi:alpha-ketoglutarate-dependent taurine dioxygenase
MELLNKNTIVDLFKSHSMLWFRGFDLDPDGFVAFSNEFDKDFMRYAGGAYKREVISGNETLLSVTGNRQFYAVPFHGEMYYTHERPTILWFYCMVPPVNGGETTLCDGKMVLQELSRSTRDLFTSKRLKYIRTYKDGAWQEIFQTQDLAEVKKHCADNQIRLIRDEPNKSIVTEYVCSAVCRRLYGNDEVFVNNILPVVAQEEVGLETSLVRLEDGSRIPQDVVREILDVTDRCTVLVAWQKSDAVMIDNTRLMHGRKTIKDPQREIFVRMSRATF